MISKISYLIFGIICGLVLGSVLMNYKPANSTMKNSEGVVEKEEKTKIIGFAPYWVIAQEEKDYLPFINEISYFGLTIASDGTIQRLTSPTETEPGWLALGSERIQDMLSEFNSNNLGRSLVVFSGDQDGINELMSKPEKHAKNLVNEIAPIIKKYQFTDLNLDIESFNVASEEARMNFTSFTKSIRQELGLQAPGTTISIDVSPTALIKPYLIDVESIAPYVDTVIFMTYDFHYQGSSVTGGVAPIGGAGESAEFDVETSIQQALNVLPPGKIILGVPIYGYKWETIRDTPRSAIIPGTGITASNKYVEDFLSECASCSAKMDDVDKESYLIYKDQEHDTYHQIYYPDKEVMQLKIDLVKKYNLRGLAIWALGYEGDDILDPLKEIVR